MAAPWAESGESYAGTLKQTILFPHRLVSIDVARVVAILLMIQGHTVDVLLSPAVRQGMFFEVWLFLRGLTAPLFFLLSGFSFALSTARRWDVYSTWSWALVRRMGKCLFLIFLGYALRLPARSIEGFRLLDASGWASWLQVDVLQCIGFTLALMQVLGMVVRTRTRFAWLAGGLCVCVVLLTPFVWGIDWTRHVSAGVASYLNAGTGSLFPLFPWSGYLFLGAAAGFLDAKLVGLARPAALHAWKVGALLIVASLFFETVPNTVYPNLDFWKTSPNLFLIRAGCACLIFALTARLTERINFSALLRCLSRESLAIYVVHVSVLYGSAWNPGLRQWIGPNLGVLATLGCVLVLWTLLIAMALGWSRLKAVHWLT